MTGLRARRGFALVYALIIVVVVGILAIGSMVTTNISRTIAANDRAALSAQQFAEAGLNRFKTLAAVSHRYMAANIGDYEEDPDPCTGGSVVAFGIDLDFDGTIDMEVSEATDPVQTEYLFEMTLPDGTVGGYGITLGNSGETLISRGFVGSADSPRAVSTRALRYSVPGSGPLNNAIFVASGGFSGPAINGNLAVYGSVHSVRGDITIGDPGLELGGTAGVYDDYYGAGTAGSDIRDVIELLGVEPETDTLCARIKLKSGDLDITSNGVNVGDTTNSIIGIYLEDQYTVTGSVANIYVDTASLVSRYNSGVDAEFPTLADNYPNDAGVDFISTDATDPCRNFMLVPGKSGNPPVLPLDPSLNIPPLVGADTAFTCTIGGNTITWHPAVKTGNDQRPGKIEFTTSDPSGEAVFDTLGMNVNVHDDVYYHGKAVFRAGTGPDDVWADIAVNGSLIPVATTGTGADGFTSGGYPDVSGLAFVSSGTMEVGSVAQVDIAALLYAGTTVTIDKQTTILGSVIAQQAEIGQNVPRIAYMPGIEAAFENVPGSNSDFGVSVPIRVSEERR